MIVGTQQEETAEEQLQDFSMKTKVVGVRNPKSVLSNRILTTERAKRVPRGHSEKLRIRGVMVYVYL
ncbi:MAG: hypothetical protein ACFCD0_19925 [Gemmataceae bacterium]